LPGSTGAGEQQHCFSTLQQSIVLLAEVSLAEIPFAGMLHVAAATAAGITSLAGRAKARKGAMTVRTKAKINRYRFFCLSDIFT
jgi:hypothetical protein